jgi:hypothetical protein
MEKKTILYLFIFISSVVYPLKYSAQVQEFCSDTYPTWTPVMNEEYHVSNNVWNSGPGVGRQCLEVDLDSSYFKVVLSDHNSSDVASYPYIRKGYHWGNNTGPINNNFPIPAGQVSTAPFTWIIDTEGAEGTWNAAFESWFSLTGAGAPNGAAELMIWLDYGGGAAPAGSVVDNIDIGGYNWDVRFMVMEYWNYIAYQITTPVDSVTLDLKEFIHDSMNRGYIFTSWWLDNMEAGFEIWRYGQGLTSNYYSANAYRDVNADTINYPPAPFNLSSPATRPRLASFLITFKWNKSIDANEDPILYTFHLSGPDIDTTITEINTDTLLFDGNSSGYTLHYDSSYSWYVEATDGMYITESSTRRTFQPRLPSGIDYVKNLPDQFILYQNFPNPFNPCTDIVFIIERGSHIDLSVYDLLGRKVRTLIKGFFTPGRYETLLDASDLTSGVYFYQLSTPYQTVRKKCVYIK